MAAEGAEHLFLVAAVARDVAALQPREYRRRHVELDREFVVRDGGRNLVDLALTASL